MMLPRKKSKNEASKPAEVQGKYVKKETSPMLRNLMPSFIRHGPTIPRRAEVPLSEAPAVPGAGVYPLGSAAATEAGGRKSFLRNATPRPQHEVSRRDSHRLSAPTYLPRSLPELPHDYSTSTPSFISDSGPIAENGDVARYYYPPEAYYDNQPRRTRRPDHFHDDYRYYEHSEINYPRGPTQPQTPQPHSRPPAEQNPNVQIEVSVLKAQI